MKCPHCGMGNPTGANFCNHCGLSLMQETNVPPPIMPVTPTPRIVPNPMDIPPPSTRLTDSVSFREKQKLSSDIFHWLISAIIVSLCCCLPCGVVGIVYAAMARTNLENGKIPQAKSQLHSAKFWRWASFFLGLIMIPIAYIIEEM